VNRPQHVRPDAFRLAGRPLAVGALVMAVLGTAVPLVRDLLPAPVAASAPQVSLPLNGSWRTYANGDRIQRLHIDGDEVWAATDGGGVVKWNKVTGAHRQYLAPQDGLRSNVVQDVEVMDNGTIWAATNMGLSKYNPTTDLWDTFLPDNSPGMPARVATALAAAPDGKLWVGFAQEWDPALIEPLSKKSGAFRPGGLGVYDPETGAWDAAYHVEFTGRWDDPRFKYVPSENVSVLEFASDGTLWIGTIPYYVFDPTSCEESDCPDEVGFWVPAGGGIAAAKGLAWQNWYPSADKSGSCYPTIIRDLAADKDGWMWVAGGGYIMLMNNGMARIGCDGQVRYEKAKLKSVGMRGRMVWSLDVDARGRVWASQSETFDKGLGIGILDHNGTLDDFDAWDTDDFWEFVDLDGVPGATDIVAGALRVDTDGRVIIGTRDHRNGDGDGLRIYDPAGGTWQPLRTKDDGLPSNQIVDVKRSAKTGDLWVSTLNHGVARFDGQHWRTWRMFQPGDQVAVTTVDARAGAANIPTDLADKETFDRLFPPESSYVRFGGDPKLYRIIGFTIANKAIRIQPGLAKNIATGTPVFAVDRGPASNAASQIAIGDDGTVWVGGRETVWLGSCEGWPYCWLDGGLGRYDGQRWTAYDLNQTMTGLTKRDGEVSAVEIDTLGRVWAGTGNPFQGQDGKGIFVYDPAAKTWSLYDVENVKARDFAGDAIADMDRDPANGDMWVAHHTCEVCSNTSPFGGDCTPSFTGGGVSRWNGTTWQKWSKRSGAFLKAAGEEGEMRSIAVDRAHELVWVGGYDQGASFHWLQGIGINAVINWCPLNCTNDKWQHKYWNDDGIVAAIETDDTGNVWVGTHRYGNGLIPPKGGVKLFNGTDWADYTTENSGLPSNEITALTSDADTMWVGTLRDGLSHYMAVPPPTETPEATNTPRATFTPTHTPTVETTPTVRPTSTLRPGVTPSATPRPSNTPAGPAPTVATPAPGECGNGGLCPLYLPLGLQRRLCGLKCPTSVPRTATRTPTAVGKTPTSEGPPTDTPTVTPTVPPTEGPTERPTAGPTATEGPPATTAPTNTPRSTATPTRTTRPTASPTITDTPTTAAPKAWQAYSGNVPRETYYSVQGIDSSKVWMVGTNSKVLFWDGQTLAVQKDSLADALTLRKVFMYSATRGYIIGDSSVMYQTRDGGGLWGRLAIDNYSDNWRALGVAQVPGSGYVGWLLGNLNGNRLMWSGSGSVWEPQSPGDRNNRSHAYSDVEVVGATLAYAISDAATGARIYSWDGTTWSPGPSTAALFDLDVPSPTMGVAVGKAGAVWRLGDTGTWTKAEGPRTGGQDLYAAQMLAPDRIWVAGARGKMYLWNGTEWLDKSMAGSVKGIRSMWMTAAGDDGWAVGDDGLVLRYQ
jgi:photosystem II stability/assembly factor-like uncharacterized protein